ncbi:hypothetical protein Pmani_033705 [Petrolisthes manimaculis]|uniref:Ig-like domain-containing protein n=1 Tax=Petrolisthes manimaculis TaxID=1843537 RepID=A0AAE1NNV2_9EUCA|nr:hypothetical protein Pmani_033705 [Petrolisthes manimaculis]
MKRASISLLFITILLQAVTSIRVERVVVPPLVETGRRVELECQYREDGDKLYSLKWWRGDDQFYQYVPPDRSHFPIRGVDVNWTATTSRNSGHNGCEVVVLDRVGLDTAGLYKCEVMADASFQTEFKEANMTVIHLPEGPPVIQPSPGINIHNITWGQRVALTCITPPASPPPHLTWLIDGRRVNTSLVKSLPPVFQSNLVRVSSRLQFTFTSHLLDQDRPLQVTCMAVQGSGVTSTSSPHHLGSLEREEGYRQSVTLHLKPSPPPSFWERMFSSSGSHISCPHYHSLLLLLLLLLLLPALFTSTTNTNTTKTIITTTTTSTSTSTSTTTTTC